MAGQQPVVPPAGGQLGGRERVSLALAGLFAQPRGRLRHVQRRAAAEQRDALTSGGKQPRDVAGQLGGVQPDDRLTVQFRQRVAHCCSQ
jgi:hypothetical protein